jgi:hypothetical protein
LRVMVMLSFRSLITAETAGAKLREAGYGFWLDDGDDPFEYASTFAMAWRDEAVRDRDRAARRLEDDVKALLSDPHCLGDCAAVVESNHLPEYWGDYGGSPAGWLH